MKKVIFQKIKKMCRLAEKRLISHLNGGRMRTLRFISQQKTNYDSKNQT